MHIVLDITCLEIYCNPDNVLKISFSFFTWNCRSQNSVADNHGGGEHGDEEERNLYSLVGFEQLLHPLRSLERRWRFVVVVLRDELVFNLLVRDQAHLGVARNQCVERESSTWSRRKNRQFAWGWGLICLFVCFTTFLTASTDCLQSSATTSYRQSLWIGWVWAKQRWMKGKD